MNVIAKYDYQPVERITQVSGVRHYICPVSGAFLPSVTTILAATDDSTELLEWRKRVGDVEADRIKREATGLGSLMHKHLEHHILGIPRPGGNNMVRIQAEKMADQIIEKGLSRVSEVWGSEVVLYCPELFAGSADMVCLFEDQPTICDFKSARSLRSRAMIEGYFDQIAAYCTGHNDMFGTDIRQAVIFMVDRDLNYREFIIRNEEMEHHKTRFLDRFERYLHETCQITLPTNTTPVASPI